MFQLICSYRHSKMNVFTVFVSLCMLYNVHGECPSTCQDQTKQPVCGTDGVNYQTYGNMCQLKMVICKYAAAGQKYAFVHDGECKDASSLAAVKPDTHLSTSADKCSSSACTTTETYLICGSDKQTYQNKCDFMKAVCKYKLNGQELTAVSTGAACQTRQSVDKCDMNCDSTSYPICGTDGQTYQNKCFFYQAKCKFDATSERVETSGLDVAHIGSCKTSSSLTGSVLTSGSMSTGCSSPLRCDSTPQKICGSDGNFYGSECEFLKAYCRNQRLSKVDCRSSLISALG